MVGTRLDRLMMVTRCRIEMAMRDNEGLIDERKCDVEFKMWLVRFFLNHLNHKGLFGKKRSPMLFKLI